MSDDAKKAPAKKKFKAFASGKSCPKCGPGVRLGSHPDRFSCGKCGYFEKKN